MALSAVLHVNKYRARSCNAISPGCIHISVPLVLAVVTSVPYYSNASHNSVKSSILGDVMKKYHSFL
ncbi:hypothetical protein J6590_065935 [Homalodisca vitripennis]|nr:hypothetical protein J6590_065935 [Homalodisca vitripennis]